MDKVTTVPTPESLALAVAIVDASDAPLLLLTGDLVVVAASASFSRAFDLEPAMIAGRRLFELGAGEWDVAELRFLLNAIAFDMPQSAVYEMDLDRKGTTARRLVIVARKLSGLALGDISLVLNVSDVTHARHQAVRTSDLIRERAVLLEEIQHRIANSLQIIASVLLQSARRVASDETRSHLYDAHSRIMSIATLQRHLAESRLGDVQMRTYLIELCESISTSLIYDEVNTTLKVKADEWLMTADQSMNLGLIVTELVINALKHAFPGQRSGNILVSFGVTDAAWTLSVADDGVGRPENPQDAKPGLGTSIITSLSKHLDATVVNGGGYPGTIVTIHHAAN